MSILVFICTSFARSSSPCSSPPNDDRSARKQMAIPGLPVSPKRAPMMTTQGALLRVEPRLVLPPPGRSCWAAAGDVAWVCRREPSKRAGYLLCMLPRDDRTLTFCQLQWVFRIKPPFSRGAGSNRVVRVPLGLEQVSCAFSLSRRNLALF